MHADEEGRSLVLPTVVEAFPSHGLQSFKNEFAIFLIDSLEDIAHLET